LGFENRFKQKKGKTFDEANRRFKVALKNIFDRCKYGQKLSLDIFETSLSPVTFGDSLPARHVVFEGSLWNK